MGYFIGTALFEISMPGNRSLKDKRRLLRPVMDKFGKSRTIAIAETDKQDLWKSATLSIVCISEKAGGIDELSDSVRQMLEVGGEVLINDESRWVFKPEEE